jgi:hypothetical protein
MRKKIAGCALLDNGQNDKGDGFFGKMENG